MIRIREEMLSEKNSKHLVLEALLPEKKVGVILIGIPFCL